MVNNDRTDWIIDEVHSNLNIVNDMINLDAYPYVSSEKVDISFSIFYCSRC